MRLFQKDPVVWGHVLIVKDENIAWEANYVLKETLLEEVFRKNRYYKIIRKVDITDDQRDIMRKTAPKLLGHPYGLGRIVLQFFDHVFHTNWFTKKADWKFLQVCSSYVAWIYWVSCRYKFNGVEWASCDPDDIEDEQLTHPEIWEVLEERRIK